MDGATGSDRHGLADRTEAPGPPHMTSDSEIVGPRYILDIADGVVNTTSTSTHFLLLSPLGPVIEVSRSNSLLT